MPAKTIILACVAALAFGCLQTGDTPTSTLEQSAPPTVTPCAAPLLSLLSPRANDESSAPYVVPSDETMQGLRSSIAAIIARDTRSAARRAADQGYTLCSDPNDDQLLVWRPTSYNSGDARLIFRIGSASPIILEVPHPAFELGTLDEGLILFDLLQARALLVAGAHRCAAAARMSPCDGKTSVCGSRQSFAVSDVAHAEQSTFHAAHSELAETFDGDWVVALHGMAGEGLHVSDGTTNPAAVDESVARVATAMERAFPGTPVATCNSFGSMQTTAKLCGTTDMQGRHTNGVARACFNQAPKSSGRFLHLEQSRAVRAAPYEVAHALAILLD